MKVSPDLMKWEGTIYADAFARFGNRVVPGAAS